MQELIEYIVKALVDNKEAISITQKENADSYEVQIKVAPEDMGKIIGKKGRIAKAIRSVAKAASSLEGKKSYIEIVE